MNYKGYEIELESFGCSVFYEGDEIVFATEEEAKEFIDEQIEINDIKNYFKK